ncbi:hypothetical protein Hanom_Chr15g01378751 [Helianthus anomalus]
MYHLRSFPAALFGRDPFGYFLSLGEKKYHSFSPYNAISEAAMDRTYKDQFQQ